MFTYSSKQININSLMAIKEEPGTVFRITGFSTNEIIELNKHTPVRQYSTYVQLRKYHLNYPNGGESPTQHQMALEDLENQVEIGNYFPIQISFESDTFRCTGQDFVDLESSIAGFGHTQFQSFMHYYYKKMAQDGWEPVPNWLPTKNVKIY